MFINNNEVLMYNVIDIAIKNLTKFKCFLMKYQKYLKIPFVSNNMRFDAN